MRRRLLLLSWCGLAVAAAGYLVLWLTAPRDRIHQESFERVQVGMTEAEVAAIVGAPEGILAPAPPNDGAALVTDLFAGGCLTRLGRVVVRRWQGERGILMVVFDEDDQVVDKFFAS